MIIKERDAIKRRPIQEKDPIKLCAKLTSKLPTTAYKSKVITFKLDEYPLQCRTDLIAFIESLEIIFYQYKETCELILDYPKNEGEDI